jgi:hypothetical protein
MKWYNILFVLLLIPFVHANGIAGSEYSFFSIDSCYGDVQLRVYEYNPDIVYNIVNCSYLNNSEWLCPCMKELKIQTQPNTTSQYAILLQYTINKTIQPFPGTNLSNDDNVFNSQLKRIYTITNITLTPTQESVVDEGTQNVYNTMFYIFIVFIVVCLLGVVVWGIIYAMSDKIKRWIGMDKNEEVTFKSVLKSIFSRKKVIEEKVIKTKEKEDKEKISNEYMAQFILDKVNK